MTACWRDPPDAPGLSHNPGLLTAIERDSPTRLAMANMPDPAGHAMPTEFAAPRQIIKDLLRTEGMPDAALITINKRPDIGLLQLR